MPGSSLISSLIPTSKSNSGRRARPRYRNLETAMSDKTQQLLHLVIGGELTELGGTEFKDLSKVEVVGFYPNYASAAAAWRAKAQQTVDNAHMRYFVVHLHRLLDPSTDSTRKA
jgi:hypothetical protein